MATPCIIGWAQFKKIGLDLGSGFGACLERGLGLGLELDNYNALCLVCLGKFHCVFS